MERIRPLDIRHRGLVTALFTYTDHFIDAGLRLYTCNEMLHRYLKSEGYKTIVFFDIKNGLWSFEREMLQRFMGGDAEPQQAPDTPPADTVVPDNPEGTFTGIRHFGRHRRTTADRFSEPVGGTNVSRPSLNVYADEHGRYKNRTVGDRGANVNAVIHALKTLRDCVVLIDLIEGGGEELEPTQTMEFTKHLKEIEDYGRLRGVNNKLIILVGSDHCRFQIMLHFESDRREISSVFLKGGFRNRFVYRPMGSTEDTINPANAFALPEPRQEDILRLMERTRVMGAQQKEVAWDQVEDIAAQLALIDGMTLDGLQAILQSKPAYNYEAFESEGVKKRGNDINSLNELIGLQSVKSKIRAFQDKIRLFESQGRSLESISKHMIFYGNPGTGKTTVARIVAGIMKDMGLLKKGHLIEVTQEHLEAGYVGQTAIKTAKVIDSALDGVLFIDEAYRLADSQFGPQALNTILARMENDRGRLAVIMAGYEEDMKRIYAINAGLMSRFGDENKVYFPDYDAEELKQIFLLSARKHYTVPEEVDRMLSRLMEHVVKYKEERTETYQTEMASTPPDSPRAKSITRYDFGNGRWVRNLLGVVETKVAQRQFTSDVSTLCLDDFAGLQMEELRGFDPHDETPVDEREGELTPMQQLDALIGLRMVKNEVQTLVGQVQYYQMAKEHGDVGADSKPSCHMVFLGNPGTGKTTVARIMAGIFHQLGLIEHPKVVEVGRATLVGAFEGHTASRVNAVVDTALGRVLFVDEVYSLVQSDNDSFGKEALDTLLTRIENDRDKMVVIFAGYEDRLNTFFTRYNPGAKSRFNTWVHFEDYTPDELLQITKLEIAKRHMELAPEAEEALRAYISRKPRQEGNGRWARNLCEQIVKLHSNRCVREQAYSRVIVTEDVSAGIEAFVRNQLI